MVFVTETSCVYCSVRAESLHECTSGLDFKVLDVMRFTACKIQFFINIKSLWGLFCYCVPKIRRSVSKRFDSRCWISFPELRNVGGACLAVIVEPRVLSHVLNIFKIQITGKNTQMWRHAEISYIEREFIYESIHIS